MAGITALTLTWSDGFSLAMEHMLTFQVLGFADLEASFENISHLLDMKQVKKANIIRLHSEQTG